MSRLLRATLLVFAFPLAVRAQGAPAPSTASTKKPLTIADYSRWRSIEGAEISPDGKWVAYALRFTNTLPAESKPLLHLVNLDTNQDIEVPNAHSPSFSSDSRWLVYQIDSVPVRGGRAGGAANSPPPATDSSAAAAAPGAATPGGTQAPAAGRAGGTAAAPPRMELREALAVTDRHDGRLRQADP